MSLENYTQMMERQHAAQASAAAARRDGAGFIPALKVDDGQSFHGRVLTGWAVSPVVILHRKRNGKELEWTGKCMKNWVGAPNCKGCAENIKTETQMNPFFFSFMHVGQTEVRNGQTYDADEVYRIPRTVTQTQDFIKADKDHRLSDVDIFLSRQGQKEKTRYYYTPAKMPKDVIDPATGQPVRLEVDARYPFTYQGNNKKTIAVLKAIAGLGDPNTAGQALATLFDIALGCEKVCPGQLGHNGLPMGDWENMPKTHIAQLIAGNVIPNPLPNGGIAAPPAGQQTDATMAGKMAPASRPPQAYGAYAQQPTTGGQMASSAPAGYSPQQFPGNPGPAVAPPAYVTEGVSGHFQAQPNPNNPVNTQQFQQQIHRPELPPVPPPQGALLQHPPQQEYAGGFPVGNAPHGSAPGAATPHAPAAAGNAGTMGAAPATGAPMTTAPAVGAGDPPHPTTTPYANPAAPGTTPASTTGYSQETAIPPPAGYYQPGSAPAASAPPTGMTGAPSAATPSAAQGEQLRIPMTQAEVVNGPVGGQPPEVTPPWTPPATGVPAGETVPRDQAAGAWYSAGPGLE